MIRKLNQQTRQERKNWSEVLCIWTSHNKKEKKKKGVWERRTPLRRALLHTRNTHTYTHVRNKNLRRRLESKSKSKKNEAEDIGRREYWPNADVTFIALLLQLPACLDRRSQTRKVGLLGESKSRRSCVNKYCRAKWSRRGRNKYKKTRNSARPEE
jgi:hypothetical protein